MYRNNESGGLYLGDDALAKCAPHCAHEAEFEWRLDRRSPFFRVSLDEKNLLRFGETILSQAPANVSQECLKEFPASFALRLLIRLSKH
jgi:hypothetical protein